jgi:hypothetical protein
LILPASLTQIAPTAFASSISNLYACYYKGTSEQFAALNYSYFNANNVLVSYYSASKPRWFGRQPYPLALHRGWFDPLDLGRRIIQRAEATMSRWAGF